MRPLLPGQVSMGLMKGLKRLRGWQDVRPRQASTQLLHVAWMDACALALL